MNDDTDKIRKLRDSILEAHDLLDAESETSERLRRFRDKQLERLEAEGVNLDSEPFEGIEHPIVTQNRDRYDPNRYQ